MNKFGTLVLVSIALQCLLQVTAHTQARTVSGLKSAERIHNVIEKALMQLMLSSQSFIMDENIPEKDRKMTIEQRASQTIHGKNLHPEIANLANCHAVISLLCVSEVDLPEKLKGYAEVETTTTKSEARALLRMMTNLRTVLPMWRLYAEASNQTATYVLLPENLVHLFTCFGSPSEESGERSFPLKRFIELAIPHSLETFLDLVREDVRLKSEFERPINTEEEAELFDTLPGGDYSSVPIVRLIFILREVADWGALEYKNYLRLRAMVHLVNEGNADTEKLDRIFLIALRYTRIDANSTETVESIIFGEISRQLEREPLLWKRIHDAERELDVTNADKIPSISRHTDCEL